MPLVYMTRAERRRYRRGNFWEFAIEHPIYTIAIVLISIALIGLLSGSNYETYAIAGGVGLALMIGSILWDVFDPLTSKAEKEARKAAEAERDQKLAELLES